MNIGDNVKIKVRKFFSSKITNGVIIDIENWTLEDLFNTEYELVKYKIKLETGKIIVVVDDDCLSFSRYKFLK